MADDRIIIAKLDIDVKDLIEKQEKVGKELGKVIDKMMDMTTSQKRSSDEYKKLEVQQSLLSQSYDDLAEGIKSKIEMNERYIEVQKKLDAQLEISNVTENDYLTQNKALVELHKQLNPGSENYAENIANINDKLIENNRWLKENGSQHAGLIKTMNTYKQEVKENFDNINIFNGGLGDFISRAKEAGGVGPLLKSSFNGMATGIAGMTKAGIAFILTPIGAFIAGIAVVVAACVGAFKFMTAAMNSTEEGSQKLAKITAAVKGLFEGFWKIIKPLGEWMGKVFIAYIETVGKALDELTDGIANALEFLGMDKAAKGLRGFKEEIKQSAKAAATLAQSEADLEKMERKLADTRGKLEKQAENLKKQRDDETKSLSERIALNKELTEVLKQQQDAELKVAYKALKTAKEKIAAEGETTDALNAQEKARVRIQEILAKGHEQESEGIATVNQIRKEAHDAETDRRQKAAETQQKQLDDAVTRSKQALEKMMSEQPDGAKTAEEQIALAENVAKHKEDIAQKEYKAAMHAAKTDSDREIAKTDLIIKQNEIRKELGIQQADAAVTIADKELQTVIDKNSKILESDKFLNDELFKQKQKALDENKAAEIAHQDALLKNKKITQQQYNDEIALINKTHEEEQAKLKTDRETAEKLAKYEVDKQAATTEYEEKLVEEQARHDAEVTKLEGWKEQGKISETQYQQFIRDEEKKTADNKRQLALQEMQNRLGVMQQIANGIGEAFGQSKEMAIVQANLSAAQSILSIWSGQISGNPVVDTAIKAVLTATTAISTAKQIKAIKEQKKPKTPKFSRGGLMGIGGSRHSKGGTLFTGADGTQFEAEQGELIGVMNRNAARHFMAFNNAFPAGGASAPNYFAGGGIVSREMAAPSLNTDDLAMKIAEANRALPAPVVAVQDIIAEGDSYVQVRDRANF
ncbi:MAG: hypothetical protein ACO1N9_05560 [Flavobacterium sp.]